MIKLENLSEKEKVSTLKKYWKYSEEIRRPWESPWQEITDYMLPRFSNFEFNRSKRGERKGKNIYDSTALTSVQTVSDGFQGYVTPESSPWYRLSLPIEQLESAPGVRRFLQDTEVAMYGELSRSNFYHTLSEINPISIALGTPTVYTEEDEANEVLVYTAMHPKEIYIHENRYGTVNQHIRRHFMTLDNLIEAFGNKVPQTLQKRAEKNPFEEVLLLHFVFPRKKRDSMKIDAINKPYASYKILENEEVLLSESGYDFDPYTTYRFMKNTDEIYGRSWGFTALPDTLRINQIARAQLIMVHKAANPPVRYPAELEGDLELDPGGMNPYRDPKKPIEKLDLVGDYPIARDQEEDIRQNIRDIFMVSFFIALQQLKGTKTATEILEMQGEKAAILSSLTNRYYTELITPLLIKTWRYAYRAGRMPEIPEVLIRFGVRGLKIDFIGPLAQIQRRFHAYQGVRQTLGQMIPLMDPGLFPEMRDLIEPDELGRHILNEGGFPQKAVRENRVVKRIRAARAKQLQQQAQLETAERVAKALPDLNQPIQKGSPLEALGV